MGNNQSEEKNQARSSGQKIILKLRYRDIILHYSFKMKLTIADISIFPDHLEGLRLWDVDIVLSRFIILENQRFKNQEVMVFKAGVGIAGITLSKWGGCKSITMCDTKPEVVSNITRNCQRNEVHDAYAIFVNLAEFANYKRTFDIVLCTDLFGQGFAPQVILNIWRKLLKVGGEAIMIVPDKKDEAKKLLELVDRQQFKINNLILTAEEYQASPLFNKLDAESEFPLLGKSTFYAICLKKLKEFKIQSEAAQIKGEVTNQKVENKSATHNKQSPRVEKPHILQKEQQRKQNLVQPNKNLQKQQKKQSLKPSTQQRTREVYQPLRHQEQPVARKQKAQKAEQQSTAQKQPLKEQPLEGSQQPAQPQQREPSNQEHPQVQQQSAKQELQNEPPAEKASCQQDPKDLEQS